MRITDLPNEILSLVASSLDPLEIIRFRMCSKVLAEATREKHLWVAALHFVQSQYGTACLSPINSLSAHDVERLATRPYRFARIMLHSRRMSSKSGPSRPFYSYALEPQSRSSDIRAIALIPGGRYLVAFTQNFRSSGLHLWDLGISGDFKPEPKPIASVDAPIQFYRTSFSVSYDASDGIILALVERDSITQSAVIYEITPSNGEAAFSLLQHLHVAGHGFERHFLSSKFIALESSSGAYAQDVLIWWNFRENTIATLNPFRLPNNFLRVILVQDDFILFGRRGSIEVVDATQMPFVSVSEPPPEADNRYDRLVIASLEFDEYVTASNFVSSPLTNNETSLIRISASNSETQEDIEVLLSFSTRSSGDYPVRTTCLSILSSRVSDTPGAYGSRPYLLPGGHLFLYKGHVDGNVVGYFEEDMGDSDSHLV